MSTISVSNIVTANGSEPLTIATGNASAGEIYLPAIGGVVIGPNSSVNSIIVSTGTVANVLVTNSTGIFLSANIASNVNFGAGTLFIDATNSRVGIKNTAPDADLTITGSANVSANVIVGNRVTANVFVGSAPNPFNSRITVASVAGAFVAPSISTAASGTLALTANRQYFVPVYVPYIFTTTTLACEVTTLGTSSSIRMNLYAADAAGAPTGSPLAADVLVSSATTGVKTGAYVATLEPGLYWASMVCNATAPTIRTMTAPATIGISTLGATSIYSYIFGTFTFGAMGAYSGVTSITGAAAATQTPLIAIY